MAEVAINSSTQEPEAIDLHEFKASLYDMLRIRQPWLHSETLSQKIKWVNKINILFLKK
jgi:hypothetical protein